ncbi:MAG: hypothetical protein ACTSWL_02935 [Promethearchaeota archaeon]
MNFIETITNSDIEDVNLIMRIMLDRIPILLINNSNDKIEESINGLLNLIRFRNPVIFYDDFINKDDYYSLIENEENDYWTSRNEFVCYPHSLGKLTEVINLFESWIIGCNRKSNLLEIIKEKLFETTNFYLEVILSNDKFKTKIIGKKFNNLSLEFEHWLYKDAVKKTEISIEKMKRILSKGMNKQEFENDDIDNIMNFSIEENNLKENLIQKEIQNFYEAAKRTFSILNRIKDLELLDIKTKISSRTLFSTIAYKQASSSRILDFIQKEWKMDFSPLLNFKPSSNFTDTFESLWG